MKLIKITAASCGFRGKTLFRGDVVPNKTELPLTVDELAIMVPRLAKVHSGDDEPAPEAMPIKKPAAKKTAKKNS